MNIKEKLRNEWANLEDKSLQYTAMLDQLEELETEDVSVKGTTVYILIQEKLKMIHITQMFYEKIGIFTDDK